MGYDHCNIRARLDKRIWPTQLDPWHIKHLPIPHSAFCSFKGIVALTQLNPIVVGDIALRRLVLCTGDFGIREGLVLLGRKEL
jgi:hypothetical protein